MTLDSLFTDIMILSILLIVGLIVRNFVKPLQKWFIPASLIGGVIGLVIGQQCLEVITIPASFGSFAGILMRIVITVSVMGSVASVKRYKAHLDYTFGNIFIFGMQIFVGVLLAEGLTSLWTGMPFGWGILGISAYFGSHGYVGVNSEILSGLTGAPMEEIMGIGMILATGGLIFSMTVGMFIVNLGVRKGWATYVKEPEKQPEHFYRGVLPVEERTSIGEITTTPIAVNPVMLHLGIIMIAYAVGWGVFKGLGMIIPTFATLSTMLYGLVGGIIVWQLMRALKLDGYCDKKTLNLIAGICIEVIIVAAMSTIQIDLVTKYWVPLLTHILVSCGLVTLFSLWYYKKINGPEWFEKCVMTIGLCTGAITNGLALVRAIDPNSESSIFEAHGVYNALFWWNNLLYPILPMILVGSVWSTLGIGAAFMLVMVIFSILLFRNKFLKNSSSTISS